jgi:hypothetical protein
LPKTGFSFPLNSAIIDLVSIGGGTIGKESLGEPVFAGDRVKCGYYDF